MRYIAIFDIPDDHVIYKGRPAMLFSHLEDNEVIATTVANEVFPEEKGGKNDN